MYTFVTVLGVVFYSITVFSFHLIRFRANPAARAIVTGLYSQTPIKRTPLGPRLVVRLIGVGTVGGAHGVTSFFIDLVWFYCKAINTALFDLNKSFSNWLKNKFKKETFDVLNWKKTVVIGTNFYSSLDYVA